MGQTGGGLRVVALTFATNVFESLGMPLISVEVRLSKAGLFNASDAGSTPFATEGGEGMLTVDASPFSGVDGVSFSAFFTSAANGSDRGRLEYTVGGVGGQTRYRCKISNSISLLGMRSSKTYLTMASPGHFLPLSRPGSTSHQPRRSGSRGSPGPPSQDSVAKCDTAAREGKQQQRG